MKNTSDYLVTFSIEGEIPGMVSIFPFRVDNVDETTAIKIARENLKSFLNITSTQKYKVTCKELMDAPLNVPLKGRRRKFFG